MNEEPATPVVEPAAFKGKPDPTWLRGLAVIWRNRRATMLPIAVTQLPLAILTAAVYFYLFYEAYPTAKFDSLTEIAKGPDGMRLTVFLLVGVQSLFALIGAAATIVSVDAITKSREIRLVDALDPAFSRMGGLLAFGVMFYALVLASFAGLIVLLYFVVRFALSLQSYVLESNSPAAAIGRSWRLMKGRMLSFTGLLLAAVAFAAGLLIAFTLVLSLVAAPFGTDPSRTHELVIFSIGIVMSGVIVIPVYAHLATSTTLFYLTAKEQSGA